MGAKSRVADVGRAAIAFLALVLALTGAGCSTRAPADPAESRLAEIEAPRTGDLSPEKAWGAANVFVMRFGIGPVYGGSDDVTRGRRALDGAQVWDLRDGTTCVQVEASTGRTLYFIYGSLVTSRASEAPTRPPVDPAAKEPQFANVANALGLPTSVKAGPSRITRVADPSHPGRFCYGYTREYRQGGTFVARVSIDPASQMPMEALVSINGLDVARAGKK